MRHLLKYLLPVMAALFFLSRSDGSVAYVTNENPDFEILSDVSAINASLSSPDADLCLPRQVSSANSQQFQNTIRRSETSHRQNYEFVRSGKTINPGLRYIVQRQSLITFSSLADPAYRLVTFCRLII